MNKIDEINTLRIRLSEARKHTEKCFFVYSEALSNESRIREKLEDLLKEENDAI